MIAASNPDLATGLGRRHRRSHRPSKGRPQRGNIDPFPPHFLIAASVRSVNAKIQVTAWIEENWLRFAKEALSQLKVVYLVYALCSAVGTVSAAPPRATTRQTAVIRIAGSLPGLDTVQNIADPVTEIAPEPRMQVQRRRVDRSKNSTHTIWQASADSYVSIRSVSRRVHSHGLGRRAGSALWIER
jgi:hypothetical protein